MLYRLARFRAPAGRVVELGSWKGRSTVWLGRAVLDREEGKVYDSVRQDFEHWSPLFTNGGYLVFDDVPAWPGPTRLVTELPRWFRQVTVSPNHMIFQKVRD